jgi:hypothetical protein
MGSRAALVAGTAVVFGLTLPGQAGAVGASPGVTIGGDGAAWQGHTQRFVAVPDGSATVVTELRRAGGATVRSVRIAGGFGIPGVAYDGSVEQVPATSATLVLARRTAARLPRQTRFVVLSTADLHVVRRITLRGAFAFDALSPAGTTMYLTEHRSAVNITRYTVRAYDLRRGRLIPGVIADRRSGEWKMDGIPATRLQTATGAWAYTLYQGGEDGAFVHALHTTARTAHCIDLPGMRYRNVMAMRLRLADGGERLLVRAGTRTVAAIDLRTFRVVAESTRHRAVAPRHPIGNGHDRQLGMPALAIGAAVALLLAACAAAAVRLRGRMQHNPAHDGRS